MLLFLKLFLLSTTTLVAAGTVHGHEHAHASKARSLSPRAVFTGFQIFETDSLKGLGLSATCEQVLYQPLKCDNYTTAFSSPSYRRSLNDPALTASVCDKSCSNALSTFTRRVNGACGSNSYLFPGYPTAALIETIWGGWNETCLTDTVSGKYCNNIIESWPAVETLEEMPKENLCSYCYTKKLGVMQQNKYGVYSNGGYQETYNYVVKTCGLADGTITLPSNGIPVDNSSPIPTCQPGSSYTAKSGDSCDSIAKSSLVSSGSLYSMNPMLLDCTAIAEGTKLCLPSSCETLHQVTSLDFCLDVAIKYEISWQSIVQWNGMIDPYCSNINQTEPNFGKVLCVSPPGGKFTKPPANDTGGNTGGHGGNGDGYSDNKAALPSGADLATGSTTRCGEFYVARSGDTCATIVSYATTPAELFVAVNPSLKTVQECSSKVVSGLTYCIHPNRGWDTEEAPPQSSTTP